MKKISLTLLFSVLMMLLFVSGCGKETSDPASEGDTYIYTVTENRVSFDENSYLSNAPVKVGDELYYVVVKAKVDDDSYEIESYEIKHMPVTGGDATSIKINGAEDFGANESMSRLSVLSDKSFVGVKNSWDETTGEESNSLVFIDANGNITNEVNIDEACNKLGGSYLADMSVTDKDEIVMAFDTGVAVYDLEGACKLLFTVNGWCNRLCKGPAGDIYFIGAMMDMAGYGAYKVDIAGGKLGDSLKGFPESAANMTTLNDNEILTFGDSGVFIYDIAAQKAEKLFSWTDVDMESVYDGSMWVNEDGTYSLATSSYDETSMGISVYTFNKVLETAENRRIKIVYGCTYEDYETTELIREFNRASEKYKIVVKNYSEEYDYEVAYDMLSADASKGGIIDIVSDPMIISSLERKKGLADLMPYLEKDSEIKPEDFFENAFESLKTDGKLYSVSPSFTIYSLAGNSKYVGTGSSWTMDDFAKLVKDNPDKKIMDYLANTGVVDYLVAFDDYYLDVDHATCNFDSQQFIDLLNIAKNFPSEEEINYENWDEFAEIQKENVILMPMTVYDLDSLQVYDTLMNGNMNIIGFPTSGDSGHFVQFNNSIAVLANSKNVEGAWEFIRSYLLDRDLQYMNGLPIRKDTFEKVIDNMKKQGSSGGFSAGGISIEINGVRDKDIETVRRLVSEAKKSNGYDEKVLEILNEEITPFFKGSKSAEEVAKVVQSRVSLYLAENN